MNLNQHAAISSLNGKALKLVDMLSHLSSNISSTESHVKIRIGELTAVDRLSILLKSDLSDKIKQEFFQAVMKHLEKKLDGNFTRLLRVF